MRIAIAAFAAAVLPALSVLSILSILSIQSAGAQAQTLKFGCYIPLTGQVAKSGKSMQNGFNMSLKDFEASGRLKGAKLVLQCEDDQNRPDDGINIARKFVEDKDVLAVLGSWGSSVTLAAGPIYNAAKIVNMTPISSHPDVTRIGPYVFRQSIIQTAEGAANAEYLAKAGAKRLAMIGLPNDYGKANIALTRKAFEAKGGTVVFEEFIRPDAQDFRATLQKAMRENPDTIYMGLFAPWASLVAKQARQMGVKLPLYGAAALDSREFLKLAGEAAEGMRLLLVYNPSVGPKMAEFFKRYEAQHAEPPDPFAANAYVTLTMMLEMVAAQLPNVTREGIREALDKVREVETIAGPLRYDPATREWNFRFIQGVVENGNFVPAR